MNKEVVTFGSATIDIFAQTSDEDVTNLCTRDHCEDLLVYHPGDKVLLEDIQISIGGGGLNTAACFSQLGIDAAFAGAIGRDMHGDQVLDWMKELSITFAGPRLDIPTNTSIILDSHLLDDRTILAYKGASNHLRTEDIDFEALSATWWYSSSLIKESFRTLLDLMRFAADNDIAFAFNPSSYQTQNGLEAIRECIELSTLLVCNKEEAEMLVGQGNRAQLCRRLHAVGADIVCITEAEHGASLLYADTIYHVDSQASEIIETTGAGDCFASTLLSGFIHGYPPEQCLLRASINAEELIRHVGAQKGLLDRQELDRRLQDDDRKVHSEPV